MNAAHTLRKARALLRHRAGGLAAVVLFVPLAEGLLFLALDPPSSQRAAAAIGAVWMTLFFAVLWLVEELLREEWSMGAIQQYVLARAEARFFWDLLWIAGGLAFVLALVAWLVGGLLFEVYWGPAWGTLLLLSAAFAFGIVGLAVFCRQLAHAAGLGGLLAPLLLFPLATPLLMAGVQGARAAVLETADPARWMLLAVFFGILYGLLGSLAVPHLLRE